MNLRAMKWIDLESAVYFINQTHTILQTDYMKCIYFLFQGTWGYRILTPPQLDGYTNEPYDSTSTL